MNVAANGDGGVDPLDVTLLDQDLSGLGTEVFDFLLADDLTLSEHIDLLIQLTHYSIIPQSNPLKHLYYCTLQAIG